MATLGKILARILALAFLASAAGPAHAADVDVLVYGGTPCGIASAIMAAREGASVLLIEPTKHVGGLSTSGINTAETEHMLVWTIGGFAKEFYDRLGKHYQTGKPEFYFESSVAEKVYLDMLAEAKVPVRYGVKLKSVESEQKRIKQIVLSDGETVRAKVFIDAGYEGDLMAKAGVRYAIGRESKAEYGEEAAGVRFDKTPRTAATVDAQGKLLPGISAWAKDLKEGDAHRGVMNYNFRLTIARDPVLQVPIPQPNRYDRERYRFLENWLRDKTAKNEPVKLGDLIEFYRRRNGKFEANNRQAAIISLGHFGGQFDYPDADDEKRAAIVQDHLDYTLGLIKFLAEDESVPANVRTETKAIGLHKDEFKDNGNLPYQLYVREGRRMRGDYVVTQKDVTTDRRKPDAVAFSSHFIDSHHVQRVALSEKEFVNEGRIWRMGYAYQIPYRALTPKTAECGNLLAPGPASFSHVAYCSYRLESVWMMSGHASGVAAAMASKAGCNVQDVPIEPLQRRLREQQQVVDFIPGQPEKCDKLNGPPEF